MVLPYNPTAPEETETLKDSQPKILENFESVKTIIEQNHVAFGNLLQGCHKHLIMPNAPIPPDNNPATSPTDLNLFARVTTGANFPQLWLKYPDNTLSQLTGSNSGSTGTSGVGWSKFPSGVIMKWGTATVSTGNQFVVFPTDPSIPVFTTSQGYIKATATIPGSLVFPRLQVWQGYGPTTFRVTGYLNPITINWFAIGT